MCVEIEELFSLTRNLQYIYKIITICVFLNFITKATFNFLSFIIKVINTR